MRWIWGPAVRRSACFGSPYKSKQFQFFQQVSRIGAKNRNRQVKRVDLVRRVPAQMDVGSGERRFRALRLSKTALETKS